MHGISIGINPYIFSIGPFTVAWHGVGMVVAIIVAVWLSIKLVNRNGLSKNVVYNIAYWGVPAGIIGARLINVFDYWNYYMSNPVEILEVWKGGIALWGGILGGILAAYIYSRVKKISLSRYADLIAPPLILAQAIGRIGDIINGEHFAKFVSPPWGVIYTNPNSPAFGRPPAHLAVGYEMVMDLLIFWLLWKLMNKLKPNGTLFLLYLALYSFGRFFLGFIRLDSHTVELGLNQAQWLCIFVFVGAAIVYFLRRHVTDDEAPVAVTVDDDTVDDDTDTSDDE